MDRRLFLLSALSVSACGPSPPRQTVICDPGLGATLTRASLAYPEPVALVLNEARPEELLDRAETESSALVVTRVGLLANRLQRLAYVRLEHRWQARIGEDVVQLLVTKGMGPGQWRALKLAKWLASEAGAAALAAKT
ncbi:MAG: hypothetical protein HY859_14525 [Caulobacterales bacterium]|nr:hypothetical protein [Caulobacterales bacterium]